MKIRLSLPDDLIAFAAEGSKASWHFALGVTNKYAKGWRETDFQ